MQIILMAHIRNSHLSKSFSGWFFTRGTS